MAMSPEPKWNDPERVETPKAAVVTGNTFIRDRSGASVEVGGPKRRRGRVEPAHSISQQQGSPDSASSRSHDPDYR